MEFDPPWLLFNPPAARRAPARPGWLWKRVREPPEAIRAAVEAQALRLQPPEGLPRCLAMAAECRAVLEREIATVCDHHCI
jgi:hypothetical protein